MNIANLKNKVKTIVSPKRRIAGIEVSSKGDGSYVFRVAILEQRKDEIFLVSSAPEVDSIQAIAQFVGTDTPIHLAVNIRGILHKRVGIHESDEQLLQAVLLNANPAEFYWQKEDTAESPIVSVIRKVQLDELLALFQSAKLWVTSLNLGNFHLRYLLPILTIGQTVHANGQRLIFDSKWRLLEMESANMAAEHPAVNIGEDVVEYQLLPAYSIAFKGLVSPPIDLNIPSISATRQEFFHKQLFKKAAIAAMVFFFCALLLNLLSYYHFKSKNQAAKSSISHQLPEIAALELLKEQVKQQEMLLKQTNVNKSNKASRYASQIGASVPAGIHLQEMEIFPLDGKATDYKEGQLLQYKMESIRIKGRCENSLTYNTWLQSLEAMPWAASIEHLTYKESNASLKEFQMQISISETSE